MPDLSRRPLEIVLEELVASIHPEFDTAGKQPGIGVRDDTDVAPLLSNTGLEYRAHPEIGNTSWTADFPLPESDVWVEVDGYERGLRPKKAGFTEKLNHLERHTEPVLIVKHVHELRAILERRGILN